MSGTPKSSGAAAGAQIDTVLGEYAKGVVSGIEGMEQLRRQAVEAMAVQNRELVAAWQKGAALLVDGLQQSARIQHDLFEIAVERGRVATRLATENVESVSKTIAGVTAVLETVAGYAAAAQKQAVEFAAAQGGTAYDAAKRQFEASGIAAADTFKRGVNTIIETQRTVMGVRDAA